MSKAFFVVERPQVDLLQSSDIGSRVGILQSLDIGLRIGTLQSLDIGLRVGMLQSLDIGFKVGMLQSVDIGLRVGMLQSLDIGLREIAKELRRMWEWGIWEILNTAQFSDNANLPDTPLPTKIDMDLLTCRGVDERNSSIDRLVQSPAVWYFGITGSAYTVTSFWWLYHCTIPINPAGGLTYDKKIRANDSGGRPGDGDNLARMTAFGMATPKRPRRCYRPKKNDDMKSSPADR